MMTMKVAVKYEYFMCALCYDFKDKCLWVTMQCCVVSSRMTHPGQAMHILMVFIMHATVTVHSWRAQSWVGMLVQESIIYIF